VAVCWAPPGRDNRGIPGAQFKEVIDLIRRKGGTFVALVTGLATALSLASALRLVLGLFNDVAGRWFGRIRGVLLGGREFGLQLCHLGLETRDLRIELFKVSFQCRASCARVRPCGHHDAIAYSMAENRTSAIWQP